MNVLSQLTGYIVNATTVCKYITTYVIRTQVLIMSYESATYFEVLTDNDPAIVYSLCDNTHKHTKNLIFVRTAM